MNRDAEIKLKNWYSSDVRKPLVIRGARQVGKSTLVKQFCKSNGLNLVEMYPLHLVMQTV
jgi:predicted AAA+ superfamily ATPase